MILTIRTDKPEAELGLFNDQEEIAYHKWQAHRELSSTIHKATKELLDKAGKDWNDIDGIVFFAGPGSFTGLRIGASLVNAAATSLGIPVVSVSGEAWIKKGIKKIKSKNTDNIVIPEYGGAANTTMPKK